MQEVLTGIVNGEFIEILDGIKDSDAIYLP